jgi:hypothetical protein
MAPAAISAIPVHPRLPISAPAMSFTLTKSPASSRAFFMQVAIA